LRFQALPVESKSYDTGPSSTYGSESQAPFHHGDDVLNEASLIVLLLTSLSLSMLVAISVGWSVDKKMGKQGGEMIKRMLELELSRGDAAR
jgi:hypothetical protein